VWAWLEIVRSRCSYPVTPRGAGDPLQVIRSLRDCCKPGWQSARCWPVAPQGGARVYEICGPDQWAELVGRYPLDVSKSRCHNWWRATGWAGRWLIPDYAAVAADWDAVHVSVAGYLTTAGIAIPAGGGTRTMLAGWDPDATWWINDVLSSTSPLGDWREGRRAPFGWTQAQ
jgi:hypothetical protein